MIARFMSFYKPGVTQELQEELENRTQMVQHLEGQLQQAHELIEDV